jgi:hypothetical protein
MYCQEGFLKSKQTGASLLDDRFRANPVARHHNWLLISNVSFRVANSNNWISALGR